MMKRAKLEKFDMFMSVSRQRSIQILIGVGLLYLLLFSFFFLENSIFASDILKNPLHVKDWVGGGRPWCPRGKAVATPNFFFSF
jgi:hypothetical protein